MPINQRLHFVDGDAFFHFWLRFYWASKNVSWNVARFLFSWIISLVGSGMTHRCIFRIHETIQLQLVVLSYGNKKRSQSCALSMLNLIKTDPLPIYCKFRWKLAIHEYIECVIEMSLAFSNQSTNISTRYNLLLSKILIAINEWFMTSKFPSHSYGCQQHSSTFANHTCFIFIIDYIISSFFVCDKLPERRQRNAIQTTK